MECPLPSNLHSQVGAGSPCSLSSAATLSQPTATQGGLGESSALAFPLDLAWVLMVLSVHRACPCKGYLAVICAVEYKIGVVPVKILQGFATVCAQWRRSTLTSKPRPASRAPYLHFFEPARFTPQPNGWTTNLPLHARRIPSSKGEYVSTPGSTNRQTASSFMAPPPHPVFPKHTLSPSIHLDQHQQVTHWISPVLHVTQPALMEQPPLDDRLLAALVFRLGDCVASLSSWRCWRSKRRPILPIRP